MTYRITIAQRIKAYRQEKGLTQSAFGRRGGVSAQAVSKWEKGLCYPDIFWLPQLAQELGCRIDDFFAPVE